MNRRWSQLQNICLSSLVTASKSIGLQTQWGFSSLGYAIPMYYSQSYSLSSLIINSQNVVPEQGSILMIGGIHGDEPEGIRLAIDVLTWLQTNIPTPKPWCLIPCLNPDGFKFCQRTNGNGVDLNRNFLTSDWTNKVKIPRYNPGPFPESEPEVKALAQLITTIKPSLILHFHSWLPSITHTGPESHHAVEALATSSNYPIQNDIGYPTPGSLGQFGWYVHHIPVVCVEIEEEISLEKIWPLFYRGFEKILTLKEF